MNIARDIGIRLQSAIVSRETGAKIKRFSWHLGSGASFTSPWIPMFCGNN